MSIVLFLLVLFAGVAIGGVAVYCATFVTGRTISRRAVRELEEIYEGLRTAQAIQLATLEAQASLSLRTHEAPGSGAVSAPDQ